MTLLQSFLYTIELQVLFMVPFFPNSGLATLDI